MNFRYKILLYYKYIPLDHPEQIMEWQRDICQRLNLKGRILISDEGINGTVAGNESEINQYISETESLELFSDLEWKVSYADEQVFPKLSIKVRDEIVTLGLKRQGQDVTLQNKAHYIEPEELQDLYDTQQDFIILDARNAYEAQVGKFANALVPPIDNFRDFPEFVENHLKDYKDKPVVTYCTGGVRCEKASAYLREQGFNQVKQLHGGIHRYAQETGGKYFEGEMFVFDKRLHVPVNQVNPITISTCHYCQDSITRYIDCAIKSCNSLFVCCQDCEQKYLAACSPECFDQVQNISTNPPTQQPHSSLQ